MTINTTINRIAFVGNGITTIFTFPYYFLANADLVVLRRTISTGSEVVLLETADYTVSGAGNPSGGNVTTLAPPAALYEIVIYRDPAITQLTDLVENDPLPVDEAVEKPLDKLTMIAQRLSDRLSRVFGFSDGDTVGGTTKVIPVANKALVFDAALNLVTSADNFGTQASDAQAAAAAAALSASSASSSETNAATSETNAATSESNAAASEASAQAIVDSVGIRDILFKTFSDSPIAVNQGMSGKMLAVDTSGGPVVVNLPSIAGLVLPFTVSVKKTTPDANTVTINRTGPDTFDDGGIAKTLQGVSGNTLIADTEPAPDQWVSSDWGLADALKVEIQHGGMNTAVATGTPDAIAAAFMPAVTALNPFTNVRVRHAASNATSTPALAIDGTTAKTIVKGDNEPLVLGDVPLWAVYDYDATLDKYVLQNPAFGVKANSIGYNQTWQNVAGIRSALVFYYNTTGRPIEVAISASITTAGGYATLTVNGVVIAGDAAYTSNAVCHVSAIVPVGANYILGATGGLIAGVNHWAELFQ